MTTLNRLASLLLFILLMPVFARSQQKTIRIACVGGSATYGDQMQSRSHNAYPEQLAAMLGKGYAVTNFGVSDSLSSGLSGLESVKKVTGGTYQVVFLMPEPAREGRQLISKPELLQAVKQMKSGSARVVLILPPPAWEKDSIGSADPATKTVLIPMIQEVAYETGCEVIDVFSLFHERNDLFPDLIHMSSLGGTTIARRLYETVTMKVRTNADLFRNVAQEKQFSSFYGYQCADFMFAGRSCKIVRPKKVVTGMPWVWRARFWGHEPQTDIALLERGFHIVYCDVAELYGNAEAITIWNRFYAYMQKLGLSARPALEGMSRGGVYIYNWALANPGKVSCIYADAPVLDLRSWPGGKGKGPGSKDDWEVFKKDYGLSEEEALQFNRSPLQRAAEIAALKVPMLHVVGDADEVVPVDENTNPFEQAVKAAGGDITVIHKPGIRHHPHSLANPTPIVDFILRSTGYKVNFAALPAPASEYRSGAGWVEGTGWWNNNDDINQLLSKKPGIDIIFVGNSITQGIAGHRSNLTYNPGLAIFDSVYKAYSWECAGISGDRTQHVLWRLQHGSYKASKPRLVVITIGVNNFPDDTPSEIAAGIRLIVDWLKVNMPSTKVLLIGPLPAGLRPTDMHREKYYAVQSMISSYGDSKNVHYLPLADTFIRKDGSLDPELCSGDGIHLIGGGYRAWAIAMKPAIEAMLTK